MNTNELLKKENFTFSKRFGQNFLSDKNLLSAIVCDAGVTKDDEVLEIGPGAGALTEQLCKYAKKVVAYEIDRTLEPVLEETLKDCDNVEVVFKDALKERIENIENHFDGGYKIVANIPYYITTPLIFKFLENTKKVDTITFLVQKEVAEKLTSKVSSPNYGALTVMINFFSSVKVTRIVKRQMFKPIPNVDSAVIHLTVKKNEYSVGFEKMFSRVVSSSFSMRRKTLVNNLINGFSKTRTEIEEILESIGLSKSVRAEELNLDMFLKLTNLLT